MAKISLYWRDTPNWYDTSRLFSIAKIFTEKHADAIVVADAGYGGSGQDAWSGSSANAYLKKILEVDDDRTFGVGFRLKVTSYPASEKIILGVIDANGNIQGCVSMTSSGTLTMWRGNMEQGLGSSPYAVALNTFVKIGFQGFLDKSDGWNELFLNGVSYLRNDGDNNAGEADPVWHGIYLGMTQDIYISHAYAGGGDGDLPHDHLVDVRRPVSDGDLADWIPNVAGGTYPTIDDDQSDGDTTFISSQATAATFSVGMQPSLRTQLYGLSAVAIVRNISGYSSGIPASGWPSGLPVSPSFRHLVVIDGTLYLQTWQSVTQEEWRALFQNYITNPATGEAWTVNEINDLKRGGYSDV